MAGFLGNLQILGQVCCYGLVIMVVLLTLRRRAYRNVRAVLAGFSANSMGTLIRLILAPTPWLR
jgi:hypothetical protein